MTVKLCRQRQNELWNNIEKRGQIETSDESAHAIGSLPAKQGAAEPVPKPASSAEHTHKISTTADIKRLQSIGALKIQHDTSGNRTVRWSVSGVSNLNRNKYQYSCSLNNLGILKRCPRTAKEADGRRSSARTDGLGDFRNHGQ